jgi:hypothetical protein
MTGTGSLVLPFKKLYYFISLAELHLHHIQSRFERSNIHLQLMLVYCLMRIDEQCSAESVPNGGSFDLTSGQ